jgi:multidrug resistance efflux pump
MRRRGWILSSLAVAAASALALGVAWVGDVGGTALLGLRAAAPEPIRVRVQRGVFVRTVLAEGYLRAVQATPINVPTDLPGSQRVAWLAPNGALVRAGEVVLRLDPGAMERDLIDGRLDLAIADAKIAAARIRTQDQAGALLLDAEQALRELDQQSRFGRRDERIYSRHEMIESEIDRDLARARSDNARERAAIVERQGRTELELLQIERGKAELRIRQAEKGLASLTAAAPHDGMLVLERNWRGEVTLAGSDVWPGQKLAEIPDPAQMQAQCYVLEADAAGLIAGRPATLVVESHPGRRYTARVANVDALAKRRHNEVPVQYFEVMVLPDATDAQVMKPGGRVVAEIELERLDDALSVPRQALVERDGQSHVWRREGGGYALVPVRLGPRSTARAVVLEGLAEGDEVCLGEPAAAAEGRP